ncbi:MAG: type II toxin-antitoxin system HicB family antitoxin [Bacteroidota bacterium]|nr:type II toxin-antitoxin system HicB family antitoxin [Bacteroidota bacterium]
MKLQKNIKAVIVNGDESGFVAECLEIPVVTQGQTLDEVTNNLKEAVELFLDGEYPKEFGLDEKPSLIITFELEPEYAKAQKIIR